MLYASTRSSLAKALGAAAFSDTLFATSKSDLTADAYTRHRASLNAPAPMSEREKEIEEIKAAELRATESGSGYQGSRARVSHVATVGMKWSEEVEQAVRELFTSEPQGEEGTLLLVVRVFQPSLCRSVFANRDIHAERRRVRNARPHLHRSSDSR